jgi:hypothetical protein
MQYITFLGLLFVLALVPVQLFYSAHLLSSQGSFGHCCSSPWGQKDSSHDQQDYNLGLKGKG